MGCRSDYMESTYEEKLSVQLAKNIVYSFHALESKAPEWVYDIVKECYGSTSKNEEMTSLLCSVCNRLVRNGKEDAIYLVRDERARGLAEWWEKHKHLDDTRVVTLQTRILRCTKEIARSETLKKTLEKELADLEENQKGD